MNQILQTTSVGGYNNVNYKHEIDEQKQFKSYDGNKKKVGVALAIKIFAIALILFGLILMGNAIYSYIKNSSQESKNKPDISFTRNGNTVVLTVKSEKELRNVAYAWNNEQLQYLSPGNKTEFTTNINIIDGDNNKLNIVVTDIEGKKTNYVEKFDKQPDVIEPEIVISNGDQNFVKIVVTDDTELDHISYRFDNGEETILNADEDNPTRIETQVEIKDTDQKTLIVKAFDASNNQAEERQEIKGTTKPKIEIIPESDPSIIDITVTDNDNLQMVVIYIGEKRYSTPSDVALNKKKFVQRVKIKSGTTIKVEAYNVNEKVATETRTY